MATVLIDRTGGNPRSLIESPEMLDPEQLTGAEPILGPLPVGELHERAIGRRLRGLSASAEHALLVAAAADTHTMRIVSQADESIGAGIAECEEAGLVELDSHPGEGTRVALTLPGS